MLDDLQIRRSINTGDALHLIEIAVLLISIGISYAKLDAAAIQVKAQADQLERIEHYLSSKDPQYWKFSREGQ